MPQNDMAAALAIPFVAEALEHTNRVPGRNRRQLAQTATSTNSSLIVGGLRRGARSTSPARAITFASRRGRRASRHRKPVQATSASNGPTRRPSHQAPWGPNRVEKVGQSISAATRGGGNRAGPTTLAGSTGTTTPGAVAVRYCPLPGSKKS